MSYTGYFHLVADKDIYHPSFVGTRAEALRAACARARQHRTGVAVVYHPPRLPMAMSRIVGYVRARNGHCYHMAGARARRALR